MVRAQKLAFLQTFSFSLKTRVNTWLKIVSLQSKSALRGLAEQARISLIPSDYAAVLSKPRRI
jgi:hypothetical protein